MQGNETPDARLMLTCAEDVTEVFEIGRPQTEEVVVVGSCKCFTNKNAPTEVVGAAV